MVVASFPQTALTVYGAEPDVTNASSLTTDADTDLTSNDSIPDIDTPDPETSADPNVPDQTLPADVTVPGGTLPADPNAADGTMPDDISPSSDDLTSPPPASNENTYDPEIQFQVTLNLSGLGEDTFFSVAAGSNLKDRENTDELQPRAMGYRFDGWYKDEQLTDKWDFDKDTVTQDITLYAKWTEVGTFTVSFRCDINIPDGESPEITPQKVTAGSKLELEPEAQHPYVPGGYHFEGWYKDENFTEFWNFDKDTVTQDITLYAKWKALVLGTNIITFNLSGQGPDFFQYPPNGSTLEKPDDPKPASVNYRFAGWYKDENFTELWNFETDVVTIDITLYAKWEEITYTVTFDFQGKGTNVTQTNIKYESHLTQTPELTPAAEGFRFLGWYKDGLFAEVWDFEKDTVTADITLYAKWEEITYTVTFDFQGKGTNVTQANIKHGGLLTQTPELTPTAVGYLFLGWYKDTSFTETGIWNFAADTVTADLTLYAKWQKVYTVTFDLSGKGANIVKTNIYEGALLSQTEDLLPKATGFHFENWYKDPQFQKVWNFNIDTVTADLTLYAKWTEVRENQCVVTFDLSGHGVPFYQYVDQGAKLKEPAEPADEGWQFLGWYLDETYRETWDFSQDEVTADLTLYAGWAQLSALQVSAVPSQPFTGKAIKPAVSVSYIESNEEGMTTRTPLKANKDYKVSYQNNINTNAYVQEQAQKNGSWEEEDTLAGGSNSTGAKVTGGFNPALPHIIIEGKGIYSGKLYLNFEITQISIGNGGESAGAGIALQCNDQFPLQKVKKDQKTITSFKYLKNTLKENIDYTAAIEGAQATGSIISKDDPLFDPESGNHDCTLTITGIGNYTGSIVRQVIVRENNTLLKNAKIALGSKCKSKPLVEDGGEVTLVPAWQETVWEEKTDKNGDTVYDKNDEPVMVKKTYYYQYINGGWTTDYWDYDDEKDKDVLIKLDRKNAFTVKVGSKWLKYGDDYEIVYANNTSIGTATMTLKGIGSYTGSKSVTFKITGASGASGGKKFSSGTIKVNDWASKMTYTGGELTQSSITLVTKKSTKIYDCGMKAGEVEDEWEDDNGKVHKIKHRHTSECYHVEVEHEFNEGEYTVTYTNNVRVGTATAVFTANPASGYTGSFKKTFKITGINVAEFVTFNGSTETLTPIVIDEDREVNTGKKDEWGDPITTTKHIHQVVATRTMESTVPYVKSGATLQFNLSSDMGTLVQNRDYTISYKNHKNVTPWKTTRWRDKWQEEDENGKLYWEYGEWEYEEKPVASKMGALVIKGKGNYTGTLTIKYVIGKGTLDTDMAVVTAERLAYNPATKTYKPKVSVWTPNAGTLASSEYTVNYSNNTKDAVNAYWEYLKNGGEAPAAIPSVTVTFKKNKNYSNLCDEKDEDGNVTKYEPIESAPVTMEFYPNKLTAKNLYIIIDNENPKELVYTGKQVTNVRMRVYLGTDAAVKDAKKNKVTNNRLLTTSAADGGQYGLIRLRESSKDGDGNYTNDGDYTLTYGKNNAIGKNKGSVTVNGAGEYGGSVSQKFQIFQNPVCYQIAADESNN